ncbi:MAG: L-aspartate oxidase [Elusimicrobia bacterium RIFOXYD2_FULL_34_15]|nr:MAG: L-aspartate oxidase [Elusimicrobia bacterium RIFOXYD2_FULL_34_15]
MQYKSDFLIIGSGISGLSLALRLEKSGSVSIITKRNTINSNTFEAQGGIACVCRKKDTFKKHIKDTLIAGDGLCKKEVVELVVKQAPERIEELKNWGVKFDKDVGLEGGHSERRILHSGDNTGKDIETVLDKKVKNRKNIKIFENFVAINLIKKDGRCCGAYVLNKDKGLVDTFLAKTIILATGGAGKVYLYTSNPDVAVGDGIAMAHRIGCKVANLEFMQFHPTCLYHPEAKSFLISEALRGEGAILIDSKGKRFIKKYHPQKELAPRDIVARAIDAELKKSGDDCVYLDISFKPKSFIKKRFPTIYEKCLSYGIDITKKPIPVVPAAHYLCGGVLTDIFGRTNISGLYAIGEVACTGLHGANRLASNSLLEGLVFSYQAAKKIISDKFSNKFPKVESWKKGRATNPDEAIVISHNWDEIRRLMWNYVGIVRSNKRLERALTRIDILKKEINQYYWGFIISQDLIELRNIATVSRLMIKSAVARKESRGLHYNIDYPTKLSVVKDTIL